MKRSQAIALLCQLFWKGWKTALQELRSLTHTMMQWYIRPSKGRRLDSQALMYYTLKLFIWTSKNTSNPAFTNFDLFKEATCSHFPNPASRKKASFQMYNVFHCLVLCGNILESIPCLQDRILYSPCPFVLAAWGLSILIVCKKFLALNIFICPIVSLIIWRVSHLNIPNLRWSLL